MSCLFNVHFTGKYLRVRDEIDQSLKWVTMGWTTGVRFPAEAGTFFFSVT